MPRDRTLSEFAGGDESSEAPDDVGEASSGPPDGEIDSRVGSQGDDEGGGPGEATGDEGAVVPMTTTYAVTTAPTRCADCGATVSERWRDGEDLVCRDCKEW